MKRGKRKRRKRVIYKYFREYLDGTGRKELTKNRFLKALQKYAIKFNVVLIDIMNGDRKKLGMYIFYVEQKGKEKFIDVGLDLGIQKVYNKEK